MRDIATNLGTTPSRHRARIALLVGLAALALIAVWYVMTPHRSPVPVSIAEVTRRDFAIYLRAIGTPSIP